MKTQKLNERLPLFFFKRLDKKEQPTYKLQLAKLCLKVLSARLIHYINVHYIKL